MDPITQLDGNLLIGIQNALNADWLTPVMNFITLFGEGGIFWIALCLFLLIFKRTRRLGIFCAASLLLTFVCCNLILKPAVDRVRPWVTFQLVNAMLAPPGDASFPSGHSANSMGAAWGLFMATMPARIRREDGSPAGRSYAATPCLGWNGEGVDPRRAHRFAAAAVVLAVLIGISRLYLGMHYPTDVICGLILGMICAAVVYKLIRAFEKKRGIIGVTDKDEKDNR